MSKRTDYLDEEIKGFEQAKELFVNVRENIDNVIKSLDNCICEFKAEKECLLGVEEFVRKIQESGGIGGFADGN